MPRPKLGTPRRSLALWATVLAAVLTFAGAWAWFRPYVTTPRQPVAEVPAPAALQAVSGFTVPAGGQACMSSVSITPNSQVAQFQLRPVTATPKGGPPVDLVLTAPGYRSVLAVPGGYPGGSVALPIKPPSRSQIGQACFVNEGHSSVNLIGTTEPRTVAREATTIDAVAVPGDIALTFLAAHPESYLAGLHEIFDHASNLTDRLIPAWLIWLLAVLIAFGVPAAVLAALFLALGEDEHAATSG